MPLVLDFIYALLLLILSPWLLYQAASKGKYREGLAAKLLGSVPRREDSKPTCVWLHAVSVGEVNLLEPLLAELAVRRPDWQCVISTTTRTGYALAKTKYARLPVFYCPLDFSWATRRAMHRIRPQLLVLTELELWPNLIRAARRSGARVAVVNGRLSERSFRGYRRLGRFYRSLLAQLDCVCAQNEVYADRFRRLGAIEEQVHVTGSIKYDGAATDRRNPRTTRLGKLAGFADDDVVFLAGSTQAPEEALALATFQTLAAEHPRLRLLLVPRHPERFAAVARLLEHSRIRFQRRSRLQRDGADPQARVLLIDVMGELGDWWGAADVGFVGGSMGDRGGQNMVEPAAFGVAVCFGPNTRHFRDVVEALLRADGAVVVHDGQELTAFVRQCLEQPETAARLGHRAQAHVRSQLGAAARTAQQLVHLIDRQPTGRNKTSPDRTAA